MKKLRLVFSYQKDFRKKNRDNMKIARENEQRDPAF